MLNKSYPILSYLLNGWRGIVKYRGTSSVKYITGRGNGGAAVLLPGFAINR